MGPHIHDRVAAYVAGEVTPQEAARIRAHCDACADCRGAVAETQAAWDALGSDGVPAPPRSLWPLLRARLDRASSPRARLALAVSASAAAVAGLALGILLGSQWLAGPDAWQQETWAQVGSLLADGEQSTLDEVYVSGFDAGEDDE